VIVLLDTSEALDICAMELGCAVKQLITPLTGFNRQKEHDEFAIDNGAFAGFDRTKFLSLLEREKAARHLCRFVVVPDVVADARRTEEVFEHWKYQLCGWPLAMAAQDGLERRTIPWANIEAIFIGGTTEWKLGPHAKAVIRAAQAIGKYVHVGRVNTPGRFEYFESLGVDSIDGTGLSRYSHMREKIWKAYHQPSLLVEPSIWKWPPTDHAPSAEESFPLEGQALPTVETASEITVGHGNGNGVSDFTARLGNRVGPS
jgi:hypothetical protein